MTVSIKEQEPLVQKSLLAQIFLEFINSEQYQRCDEEMRRQYASVMLLTFCA